jgi:heme-degrading monooxygenase HmoA
MIAVIFEVWPKPERKKEYLDIAAQLRLILEKIDGSSSFMDSVGAPPGRP